MKKMASTHRRHDWIFHQLTRSFSWLVLVALAGIIVSLIINAWPAFHAFGIQFIWRVEWDTVNQLWAKCP